MSAFDKVIGYKKEKQELLKVVDMIKNPEKYEKLGASLPQGALLYGEPGVGKTLMARCFIEECGVPTFTLRSNKGTERFVDEITDTFLKAKKAAPAIIFLDDVDKFSNEGEERRDTREYVAIQSGIDEIKGTKIFVIATANHAQKLPASLKRAGRFDMVFRMGCPSEEDSEAIIKYYMGTKAVGESVDLVDFSKMIRYSSCAKLETLINKAAVQAAYEGKAAIEMEDLVGAVLKEEYGVCEEDLNVETSEEIRKTALHEAGHAVVSEVLTKGAIGLIALQPRENGLVNGVVHLCRDVTRRPYQILTALAGKAAVEMEYCETVASGAHSDLEKAFNEIRTAISESGTVGLGMIDVATHRFSNSSESFVARNEAVTTAELERYMLKCREILIKNREFLKAITEELVEKKILLNSDVKRIRERVQVVEVTV